MPIYEYECERSRLRFELKRCFGEDGGTPCPQCQGHARHLFSPVPIIFNGSGFYVTDSRKNHNRPLEDSKSGKLELGKKLQSD